MLETNQSTYADRVEAARDWASTEAPPAIASHLGHVTIFRAACELRRKFKLNYAEILDVLDKNYNPRCQPPFCGASLVHKAQEACRLVPLEEDGHDGAEPRSSGIDSAAKEAQRKKWQNYIEFDEAPVSQEKPGLRDVEPLRAQCERLANERGIPVNGALDAVEHGILVFGRYHECDSDLSFWAVRSASGGLVEARRFGGEAWPRPEGAKAKKFKGSEGALIGEQLVPKSRNILLVEGGPDFLSAMAIRQIGGGDWWPLAFLGVLNSFDQDSHRDALAQLAGKHVRIIVQDDQAGRKGAKKWEMQLRAAGVAVSAVDLGLLPFAQLDGKPIKDLNDLLLADEAKWRPAVEEMLFVGW